MFITYDLPNLGHTFSIIVKTHNYDGTNSSWCCVYIFIFIHYFIFCPLLNTEPLVTITMIALIIWSSPTHNVITSIKSTSKLFSWSVETFSVLVALGLVTCYDCYLNSQSLRLKLRPRNHVDGRLVCTTGHFSFNQLKRLSSYPPPKRHKEGQGVNTSIGSIRKSKHFLAK